MKRRGFFKAVLALMGLKALGADKKSLPIPYYLDTEPVGWEGITILYHFKEGKWHKVSERDGIWREPWYGHGSVQE